MPNNAARVLHAVAATIFMAASLPLFAALPQRTFVRSDGSDSNPCSLVLPCRGFAAAVTAVATKGEVIVLDSAGYGSATLTKSVSLISPAGIYAGITVPTGSNGITVNASGATVVLRGLSINGQGGTHGVVLQSAARLRIENCVISGMSGDGVHHTAADAELIVLDTIVRDNGGSGVQATASGSVDLHNVRGEHNAVDGLGVAPAAGTLGITVTVSDSVFTHNAARGVFAGITGGATTTVSVERTVMAGNGADGFRLEVGTGSAVASVTRSLLNDNGGDGLFIGGGHTTGLVAENIMKRNSGNELNVTALDPDVVFVQVTSNATTGNIRCEGLGSEVQTFKNNVIGFEFMISGCSFTQVDGK